MQGPIIKRTFITVFQWILDIKQGWIFIWPFCFYGMHATEELMLLLNGNKKLIMTTVIVPLDFSENSLNALDFAANFLQGSYGIKIILYHAYSKENLGQEVTDKLEAARKTVIDRHPLTIDILAHHEDNFVAGLERAARHRGAELVIMAATRKSAISQTFFESNFMKFSSTKACPVLMIPEGTRFHQVKNVMLASDFKDTLNTTPSGPIKDFLSLHRPQLHIVNVDKDHYISLSEKYESEKLSLKKLLEDYHPEFYFMRLFDTQEAIDLFARDHAIDLIILVEREQTIMRRLFSSSTTRQLTYDSQLPILIIHQ